IERPRYALFGVVCISPDALLVRFLTTHGADPWTIVFWRLLFSIPFSAIYAIYDAGGVKQLIRIISSGRRYYSAAVPIQATVDICFTISFVHTSAALALLLISLNSLWGAIIGKIVLKDELPLRTYVAMILAFGCMLIIFVPEIISKEEENIATTSLAWAVIPLITGFLSASYFSIVRLAGRDDISLVGGTPLGAAVGAISCIIVKRGQVLPSLFWDTDMWKFWLATVSHGVSIGLMFVAMSIAPRYITASETALCGLLEVILGPLFVFFAYNVVPGKWTLIGGSLLLIVLAAHESIPLFSKSREMYRRFSKRLSSEIGNDDKETQHMLAETLIGNGDEEIS
ncbi:hypothetical protein ACHAXN_003284, partial [Cyclotella atomus]